MKYHPTNYRQNLISYWRQFYPEYQIPTGYHVHHIKPKGTFADLNDPRIHHPRNLIALHPDDHFTIHICRGDKYINAPFMLSLVGYSHTEKTRQKMSDSHKGISPWNKGKKLTNKHKQKLSDAKKGKPGPKHTAKTKQNMSDARKGLPGRKKTDEEKMKISKSHLGMKRSIEAKAKMSLASKGKPKSEEHRASMSRSRKGISHGPRSEETKQKISQTLKNRKGDTNAT